MLKEKIEEYFRTEALSQSFLLSYAKHPRSIVREEEKEKLYYEEKMHFIKGSLGS